MKLPEVLMTPAGTVNEESIEGVGACPPFIGAQSPPTVFSDSQTRNEEDVTGV
jgi:hypothetical protein